MTFSCPRTGNNGEQQGVLCMCEKTKAMNKEKDFFYLL